MTQLFADDEQLGEPGDPMQPGGLIGAAWPMIRQRRPADDRQHGDRLPGDVAEFGPALTAGKGVRAVRCIGCSEPTLPRAEDNAPLCARCSDLLDGSQQRSSSLFSGRWRRRR